MLMKFLRAIFKGWEYQPEQPAPGWQNIVTMPPDFEFRTHNKDGTYGEWQPAGAEVQLSIKFKAYEFRPKQKRPAAPGWPVLGG